MARGDVNTFAGGLLGAEVRNAIESLDGEGVRGVRLQAQHLHPATQQAFLRRAVAHGVSAGNARALGRPAVRAPDGVVQVCSAAVFQRLVPLQDECGVIHVGDDASRR